MMTSTSHSYHPHSSGWRSWTEGYDLQPQRLGTDDFPRCGWGLAVRLATCNPDYVIQDFSKTRICGHIRTLDRAWGRIDLVSNVWNAAMNKYNGGIEKYDCLKYR